MKWSGFTLMELIITVAILAILVAIAIPSFNSYLLKSHRSDAYAALMSIQLSEERYRGYNSTYGTLAQVWGGVSSSENGRYTLSISNISATSYTISAAAVGAQANDAQDGTSCATLTLASNNGAVTKSPAACW